ncbi:unnamed protein product, partial [Symbiodinium microadriaticum]
LIAILSQNYEMQQDRAQGLFVQARARMLLEAGAAQALDDGGRLAPSKALRPHSRDGAPPLLVLERLAEISLLPLRMIMEPLVGQGAYYQKNVFFERFLQRALWSPVSRYKILALGIPVVCQVLLAGSLTTLLVFAVLTLLLQAVGFRLTGIRYTLNLSLFGFFGDRFAEECEIFALVRTETALDDLRSMRSDLKDLLEVCHYQIKIVVGQHTYKRILKGFYRVSVGVL